MANRAIRRNSKYGRGLLLIVLSAAVALAQATSDAPGKTVSVNGIEMYYETSGEGEPLLLLHGFFGSGRSWSRFVPEFAKHYQVIVPDLRGHGRSTNPSKKFTHRQAALDVFALLDELGIKQVKAMGSSTGGMTLIHMATQQPERVEAMVLIGATIYFPEQAREIMRQATVESLTPEAFERRRQIHTHGDGQIRALQQAFHDFRNSYDDMNFTGPYLSTITARTLIVHGDRDRFFPVEIPLQMYASIPNSYLWIVPRGGHGPISDPDVPFVPTALKFLKEWGVDEQ